ncbi:MAG: GntR family transcriptional regulator [Chitinivibrionales bacterium]|nr:GntR family transcriptional regulator [Chitinivibrionales bacterium]
MACSPSPPTSADVSYPPHFPAARMNQRTTLGTTIRTLDDLMRRASAEGVTRLPTIAALAARFGVSTSTVQKAVDYFAARGVVTVSRGKGIHLVVEHIPALSPERFHNAPERKRAKWRRLTDRLRADIAGARYAPGSPLPSHKELTAHYGICHRTLRRALDELLADGTLEQWGRSCRVPSLGTGAKRGKRVVLITRGDSFGDPEMFCPRTREHLRLLESECVRAGVRLQSSTCHYIGLDLVGLDRIAAMQSSPSMADSILGYIVWAMGLTQSFLDDLLVVLASSRKPVAVLDEDRGVRLPQVPGIERARLFQMAISSDAGRTVGEYLLKLGHRRVAFVTQNASATHAVARLAGLRQAFTDAGFPEAVSVWNAEDFTAPERAYDTPDNFLDLLERILPGYQGMPTEAFSVRERIPVWFANRLALAPRLQRKREQLFALLDAFVPAMRQTAWVGESDDTCLTCLDYLRLKGLSAPEDVSVVGFDDSFEAFLSRLTTYNFNGAAYMRAMLDHVLTPFGSRAGRTYAERTDFPGFVVERWTTGRAKP